MKDSGVLCVRTTRIHFVKKYKKSGKINVNQIYFIETFLYGNNDMRFINIYIFVLQYNYSKINLTFWEFFRTKYLIIHFDFME